MNKSAILGFVAGLVVLGIIAGGYYLTNSASQGDDIAVRTTAAPAAKTAAKPETPPAPEVPVTTMQLARTATGVAPDGTVDITLQLTTNGAEEIRALGIEELLPEGWSFNSTVSPEKPDLNPTAGRTGKLEFAWFNIPKFPVAFTYRVNTGGATPKPITGEALFRTTGPEIRSNNAETVVGEGAPAAAAAAPAAAPAPVAAAATPAPAGAKGWNGLKLTQTVVTPFTPGGTGELGVALDFGDGDPVAAMAVTQKLPEGWVFEKVTGGSQPAVMPNPGQGGEITFIWIQVPTFPTTFNYSIKVPETSKSADFITGQAVYRRAGGEERTEEVITELPPAS